LFLRTLLTIGKVRWSKRLCHLNVDGLLTSKTSLFFDLLLKNSPQGGRDLLHIFLDESLSSLPAPDPLAVAVCTWSCSEYLSPIVIFLSSAGDVGSSPHYQHTNFYWLHEADQPSCCLSGRADLKHKLLLKHYIVRCTRLWTMTL